jgi:predicted nucleic acid-binding protein
MWYRGRGRGEEFRELVQGHLLAISFACVGEVLAPTFMRRGLAPGTSDRIKQALGRFVVLPYDAMVVGHWAKMSALLEGQLKGRGINDMWTAACALAYDLPIVTNNLSDFQTIQKEFPELKLVHPDLENAEATT